jgi:hypothetical protein
MPYDERIRDPLLTTRIASEGLSEDIVSIILLETMKGFFLSTANFTTWRMRHRTPPLLYTASEATTKIRIVRDIDWVPETMGASPELVIRPQGTMWTRINNAGLMDQLEDTVEDPDRITNQITGRCTIWAISQVADEASMIATEIAAFLSVFSLPLMKEYGFDNLAVAGLGNAVRIKERKQYWGYALTIGYVWTLAQELIEQQPRLAELYLTTTPTP